MSDVYAQYSHQPEYDRVSYTCGGFAIIPGLWEEVPSVLIKQRNGKGGSPWLFDLPGGGCQPEETLARTAMREAFEEVELKTLVSAPIGEPLWLPIRKYGELIRVDYAQCFLVSIFGDHIPRRTEEAVNVGWLNQHSWQGFNIVGLTPNEDPQKRVFGRTAIMMFDGLSVLQKPFYQGPMTPEIEQTATKPLRENTGFALVSGGAYFAKWDRFSSEVSLYYRLNPFEKDGRFTGNLEHLVQSTEKV